MMTTSSHPPASTTDATATIARLEGVERTYARGAQPVHALRGVDDQGMTHPGGMSVGALPATHRDPHTFRTGSTMTYRLHYFAIRGRGEQVRLFLHALATPFHDVIVDREQFLALKAQGASALYFGALPMLEDADYRLCQGPVILSYLARRHGAAPTDARLQAKADAIAWGAEDLRVHYFKCFGAGKDEAQAEFIRGDWQSRWLPSLSQLLEQNGSNGFFVGNGLSHADIAMWDVLNAILENIPGASLDGHAPVTAFYDAMRCREAIAAYLACRPT